MKPVFILAIACLLLHPIYAKTDNDTTKFCVAVVQLVTSEVGDFRKMDSFAFAAKRKGANLVVFPEESVFGWLNPAAFTRALPIPGKYSEAFARIAKKNHIWVSTGIAEKGPRIDSIYYEAYDASILINPYGNIVYHYRQHNVIKNAFDSCPPGYGTPFCSYKPGKLSEVKVVLTPFGRTSTVVCADAYTFDTSVLSALKQQKPYLVIVNWGITDTSASACGQPFSNATQYAVEAAKFLQTAYVIGANAVGDRNYGRFLPSYYCGTSGFATPSGQVGGTSSTTERMHLFYIPYPQSIKKKKPAKVPLASKK